jgi:hypothetical protein
MCIPWVPSNKEYKETGGLGFFSDCSVMGEQVEVLGSPLAVPLCRQTLSGVGFVRFALS